MSSSDDHYDKKLRKHFQDVFDDFEVQPSASLKERIWQFITQPTVARREYGLLAFSLVLLLGTGFFYQQYGSRLQSYQTKLRQAKQVTPVQPVEPGTQVATKKLPTPEYSHAPSTAGRPTVGTAGSEGERKLTETAQQPDVRSVEQPKPVALKHESELGLESRKDIQKRGAKFWTIEKASATFAETIPPGPSVAKSTELRTKTPEIPLSTPFVQPEIAIALGTEKAVSWHALQPLSLRSVGGLRAQISRNVVARSFIATSLERPITPKTPVRWLLDGSPLSTYQLMTVVDKPDAYVQRVEAPAAFSGPTWGYQLRGGIEWRQLDLTLSLGQIRRWAYYDLATNTFQVEALGAKQYRVTRLEAPVAENVSMTMLGASVRKLHSLGGANSRFFVRLGGDLTYVPDTRQSLIWASAMVGATLPLLKTYQLQLGPTVEYGFSRIWSTERQLIIRPYLVGASITLRPGKP
ncbi:hypothetical protein [Spirosoma koreense]